MRIATYNVHGWCDATGRKRIDDFVALLGGLDCDVIVLNEVLWFDSVLPRVAAALDMATTFAPAGFGGNAILARVPICEGASVDLHDRRFQTRSAAIARVTLGALAVDADRHRGSLTRLRRLRGRAP